jgi:hypothetical protein
MVQLLVVWGALYWVLVPWQAIVFEQVRLSGVEAVVYELVREEGVALLLLGELGVVLVGSRVVLVKQENLSFLVLRYAQY